MRRRELTRVALLLAVLGGLAACRPSRKRRIIIIPPESSFLSSPGRFEPEAETAEPPPEALSFPQGGRLSAAQAGGAARLGGHGVSSERGPAGGPRPDSEPLPPSPGRLAGGPTPQREPHDAAPRPDQARLARPSAAPQDLSPAALKRRRAEVRPANIPGGPDAGAVIPPEPEGTAAAAAVTASMPEIAPAAAPDVALADLSAGSLRVQVSLDKDFRLMLLDKAYLFADRMDIYADLDAAGAGNGRYWVRIAHVDLLDFQHPFSRPRLYRFTLRR